MSLQIELKKSAVPQKQPFPSDLALGEIALNYSADGPFLTCKDTAGNIRKLTAVWVGATAPSSPTAGDPWLDTSSTPVFKLYTGSAWTAAVTVSIATTSGYGTVRLATSADITNGTAGKIVDAAQLASRVTSDITAALAADPLLLNSLSVSGNATINGNLVVNGTQTIINTQTLDVEDRNIVIGKVSTPTDVTANTGGITLKGTTDKTFSWLDATDSWTSSEHIDLASGKGYRINGTEVLSSTALGSGVTSSSLTTLGTITTGTWEGSAIVDTHLATISTAGKVSNSATTATDANTADAIVARDGSGNFSAGTITAALSGNAATATKLSSARTFALTGDVTGTVDSDLTSGASITAAIASGVIVDGDVNANADIAFSKLQDVSATDKLLGRSSAGAGAIEEITCTAAGRALLDDADATAQRVTLGLEIGVDVQAYDSTLLKSSDIGVSVQAYDADTAKLDTAQSFTALQTFDSGIANDGPYTEDVVAVAALDVDCSLGNYFTKTIAADSIFTFSNPPASGRAYAFTLELTHTSGVITWPTSVKWPSDITPTLTTGKTHLFMFVTKDSGTRWRGAALVNYVD
jgi:hypothetical protein